MWLLWQQKMKIFINELNKIILRSLKALTLYICKYPEHAICGTAMPDTDVLAHVYTGDDSI